MNDNQVNAMYVAHNGSLTDGLSVVYSTTGGTTSAGLVTSGTSGTGLSTGSSAVHCWNGSAWDFWQNCYYPQVIRESYPVYIQNRAEDKGKQAFEIIKQLQDKRLMKLEKVSDFIDAMDCLIKIL